MSVSILVMDDESDVAELFRQQFLRDTAPGGLCLNMPGMDGLQLLDEIKQLFPDQPVIMVTAYGDDERRRWSMAQQSLLPNRST